MNVYFISGLGADERIFKNVSLPDGYEIRHIPWQTVRMEESIQDYARRLARDIDASHSFILTGLSFGGIIATEICKFLTPEKLILFSTVAVRSELPALYKLAGKWHLYKFFPAFSTFLRLPFIYWFFGPLDKACKLLLRDFIDNNDPVFMKWAIKQISVWQNEQAFKPSIRIHGSLDKAFPLRLCKPDYIIKGAGHLCIFTHAGKVNEIIRKEFDEVD